MYLICTGQPHACAVHPDYIPSLFPSEYRSKEASNKGPSAMKRYERMKNRRSEAVIRQEAQAAAEQRAEFEAVKLTQQKLEAEQLMQEKVMEAASSLLMLSETEVIVEQSTQADGIKMIDFGTQKEDESESVIRSLVEKNKALTNKVFGVGMIEGSDTATKFYTGLPTWGMFLHVFMFLSPFVTPSRSAKLDDEYFAVLVRLRLNLFVVDLASRLGVSSGTLVNIFQKWLDVMFVRLQFLITWPSRETVRNNMPLVFEQLYPNCRVIIDCSEIFIETPTSFDARCRTYSNYKKHNTVKFLIGITPCGTISYLSHCWGGRVSDKNITQESSFLSLLEPGDTVLADRGFTLSEDIAIHGASLEIPAFTRGKQQLSQEDAEKSKQLSKVRIHVERVIGLLKNRYTILKGTLSIKLIKHKEDTKVANIDKLLTVCSALTNLGESVVVGCV